METTLNEVLALLALDPKLRNGQLKHGGLVQIIATSTSYTIWPLTTDRAAWLLGLLIYNDAAGAARLSIGTGDFTANMPQIGPVLSTWGETLWLPPREFTADIVVQSDAGAASPNEVEIQAWVWEV